MIVNGVPSGLAKYEDWLYMSMNESTHPVLIYNIVEPKKPNLVGYIPHPSWYIRNPVSVKIVDNKWLWMDYQQGHAFFDLQDPSNPKRLDESIENSMRTQLFQIVNIDTFRFESDGKIIKIYTQSQKLTEINRDNFQELVSNDINFSKIRGVYENNKLYVVISRKFNNFWGFDLGKNVEGTHDGIAIFDINEPSKPILLGWYIPPLTQSPINITGIVYHKGYIFGSDRMFGLRVFDVRDPKNINLIFSDRQGGDISALAYIKKRKLVCMGQNILGGFVLVDISNPNKPEILSKICVSPARIYGKMGVYKDRYIYAQGDWSSPKPGFNAFFIIDTKNPRNPKLTIIPNLIGRSYGMLVIDDYLYTSSGTILEIKEPENPKPVGSLPCSGYQLAYKEPYLYVANFLGEKEGEKEFGAVYVVDIKDRLNPKLVGKLLLPFGFRMISMEFFGKYLFLGWCQRPNPYRVTGLLIAVDISDPTNPKLVKQWDSRKDLGFSQERGSYTHVWTDGKYLFVGIFYNWLGMYEIIEKPEFTLKSIQILGDLPAAWFMFGEDGIIYRICRDGIVVLKYGGRR
jgi:hypothetical protein